MRKGSTIKVLTVVCRAEKRLWAAVVEKAVEDALVCSRATGERKAFVENRRREAVNYLFSNSVRPHSFLWVCDLMSLSPQAVREFLREKGVEYVR